MRSRSYSPESHTINDPTSASDSKDTAIEFLLRPWLEGVFQWSIPALPSAADVAGPTRTQRPNRSAVPHGSTLHVRALAIPPQTRFPLPTDLSYRGRTSKVWSDSTIRNPSSLLYSRGARNTPWDRRHPCRPPRAGWKPAVPGQGCYRRSRRP